jgi:hypothetical protein
MTGGVPPHFLWLLAAILLAGAELLVPGSFLIWLAAAAALTGVVYLLTGISIELQFITFALLSVGSVLAGRRLYALRDPGGGDARLNDRVSRLIGEVVEVVTPIEHGRGRVRVGDGVWPARGPDLPAGTRVRVTGAEGTCLTVEAAALPSPDTQSRSG